MLPQVPFANAVPRRRNTSSTGGTFVHIGVCFSFFVCFLSSLVWFFLWLPEEVLALLFFLHHENGDFSILMKDILETLSPLLSSIPEISWNLQSWNLNILPLVEQHVTSHVSRKSRIVKGGIQCSIVKLNMSNRCEVHWIHCLSNWAA
jgi:hypothetical protein